MVGVTADVREYAEVREAYKKGVAELGAVTIVVANAGIGPE
jgi:NAD(P)-dependent dehydrogenase (short-subunit alcohol dehydrogenase family)